MFRRRDAFVRQSDRGAYISGIIVVATIATVFALIIWGALVWTNHDTNSRRELCKRQDSTYIAQGGGHFLCVRDGKIVSGQ